MKPLRDEHKYDDIINLPRPVSKRHAPMSNIDRAAQFSPFAALTGFDGTIQETARLTDGQAELDESSKAELNEKLQLILESIDTQPQVTITYFQNDERKSGGAYISVTGRVKKIDPYSRCVVMTDGSTVSIDRICDIEIKTSVCD